MFAFKHNNSIFFRLISSYSILVIMISLILGSVSYMLFSANYKEEVEKVHEGMLQYLEGSIESNIINIAKKAYIDLTIASGKSADVSYFFNNPVEGNHSRLFDISNNLNDIVKINSEIIDSIHLYYSDINTLVSTSLGIKYLNDDTRDIYRQLDWLVEMANSGKATLWLDTREVPENIEGDSNRKNILTYVRTLPFSIKKRPFEGIIAIDIKEQALSNLIVSVVREYADNTYIINRQGLVISNQSKDLLYQDYGVQAHVKEILLCSAPGGNFVTKVHGITSMVSYNTLAENGWILVNHTSLADFYKKSAIIQRTLLLIVVGAIIIGLVLAGLFTSKIYNPIKMILGRIRNLGPDVRRQAGKKENEYIIINEVINNLSVKVNELEGTLQANSPLIKHNLVTGLLYNKISTNGDLSECLKLLKLSMDYYSYTAVLIRLAGLSDQGISLTNRQFILYNLVSRIDNLSSAYTLYISTGITESEICAVICAKAADSKFINSLADNIISYSKESFLLSAVVVAGKWVSDPLKLYHVFDEIRLAGKYIYFTPEAGILFADKLAPRENSGLKLSENVFEALSKTLNTRNMANIQSLVFDIVKKLKEGQYPADYCHECLGNMVRSLVSYARAINYKAGTYAIEDTCEAIQTEFKRAGDMNKFHQWYVDCIKQMFEYVKIRDTNKTALVIDSVKKYVDLHLGNELSLDLIADKIQLTPRYLSRLFKNETGINLTDYINQQRLNLARKLLMNYNYSIDEISQKAGYNSTTYFIQKFKEAYGDTPKNCKRAAEFNPALGTMNNE